MKKVTFTFVGNGSDQTAEKFYSWVVDGGLEDYIVDRLTELTDEEIQVDGICGFNNDTLDISIKSFIKPPK
jgi:hypothetical protein